MPMRVLRPALLKQASGLVGQGDEIDERTRIHGVDLALASVLAAVQIVVVEADIGAREIGLVGIQRVRRTVRIGRDVGGSARGTEKWRTRSRTDIAEVAAALRR